MQEPYYCAKLKQIKMTLSLTLAGHLQQKALTIGPFEATVHFCYHVKLMEFWKEVSFETFHLGNTTESICVTTNS